MTYYVFVHLMWTHNDYSSEKVLFFNFSAYSERKTGNMAEHDVRLIEWQRVHGQTMSLVGVKVTIQGREEIKAIVDQILPIQITRKYPISLINNLVK